MYAALSLCGLELLVYAALSYCVLYEALSNPEEAALVDYKLLVYEALSC